MMVVFTPNYELARTLLLQPIILDLREQCFVAHLKDLGGAGFVVAYSFKTGLILCRAVTYS